MADYKRAIEENFLIVDKEGKSVPFLLNHIQSRYLLEDTSDRDVVLKARQQGFTSINLGRFSIDFLLKENSNSVVLADISENASALLQRVKYYVGSYEEVNKVKVPMKYNSKNEMFHEPINSRFTIGTAENTEFGRSQTITNLLITEAAFYKNMRKILAGALQAVVPGGKVVIETTANGFNEFKTFWEESKMGLTGFKPLFYRASDFYSQEFLAGKKMELGQMYTQEYPDTDTEAFLTSGRRYFDTEALKQYLALSVAPI